MEKNIYEKIYNDQKKSGKLGEKSQNTKYAENC